MRGLVLTAVLLSACDARDGAPPVPSCEAVAEGVWRTSGPGMGMPMEARLTFDADACTFTLTDWTMWHDGWTEGGILRDAEVQLTGEAYWESCLGEVDPRGTYMAGTCAASQNPAGGAFALTWLEP